MRRTGMLIVCLMCGVLGSVRSAEVVRDPPSDKPSISLGTFSFQREAGFVPVEPYPAKDEVEVVVGGQVVKKDIRLLTREESLRLFADTRSVISVAKVETDGKISYLAGSITGEKGKYLAVMDFASFVVTDLRVDGKRVGRARVGVGLRLVANVNTRKKGIDLGGLIKIGLSASRSELDGTLEVRAIGVSSSQILSLLPGILPAVDETSIQSALEAMAAVKAKIYEEDTTISPRVLAIEVEEPRLAIAEEFSPVRA